MRFTTDQIKSLREQGVSWADIFRRIMAGMHPEARTHVHLFSELLLLCKIDGGLLNQLQRWNYWFTETGYADAELERLLEGKIALKD
mgnify:CR=1 FL=1